MSATGVLVTDLDWLEPWRPAGESEEDLVYQLHREVVEGHPLFGKELRPLARRHDRGDLLVEVGDGESVRLAVVDLSWRSAGVPGYPGAAFFPDLESWVRMGMVPDHEDYVAFGEEELDGRGDDEED